MNITDDWRRAGRFVPALLVASALVTAALGSAGCNLWGKNDGGVVVGPQPTTPTSTVVTSPTVVATLSAPPSSTSSAVVHERPIPPQSTAPRPSSSAQDAMRAWYLAWFVGDMDAAKRTSTTSFASTISEHTFEGGDVTDYKILGTEGAAGTTAFYISETREGVAEKTQMTVLVGGTDAGSGYLVKGYDYTPPGTVPASPPPPDPTAAVGMAAAEAVVTEALQALHNDQVSSAKALATARFVKANPRWFAPASGALAQFSISSPVRRHDVWVVKTAEEWRGGAIHPSYVVDTVGGEAKIDRVKGWY